MLNREADFERVSIPCVREAATDQKVWSEEQCQDEVIPLFNRFSQLQVYIGDPDILEWVRAGIQDPTRVEVKEMHTGDSIFEIEGDKEAEEIAEDFLYYFNALIMELQSFETIGLEILVDWMETTESDGKFLSRHLYGESRKGDTDNNGDDPLSILRNRISEAIPKALAALLVYLLVKLCQEDRPRGIPLVGTNWPCAFGI